MTYIFHKQLIDIFLLLNQHHQLTNKHVSCSHLQNWWRRQTGCQHTSVVLHRETFPESRKLLFSRKDSSSVSLSVETAEKYKSRQLVRHLLYTQNVPKTLLTEKYGSGSFWLFESLHATLQPASAEPTLSCWLLLSVVWALPDTWVSTCQ